MDEFYKYLFYNTNVRLYGTDKDPLFAAIDVGKLFGDHNIYRVIRSMPIEYYVRIPSATSNERSQDRLFFTEEGLYYYVLTSNRDNARKHRVRLLSTLRECRPKHIDSELVEDKIDRDNSRSRAVTAPIRELYDDLAIDACPRDMCEFYIEHYIRTLRTMRIKRSDIHSDIVELLYEDAIIHFRKDQHAYRLIVAQTLNEYLSALKASKKRPRED